MLPRPYSDYIAVKIDDKYFKLINSVESFVKHHFLSIQGVEIWGYPIWAYPKTAGSLSVFINSVKATLTERDYYFSSYKDTATEFIDSTVKIITYPIYRNSFDTLNGFSGSPVFIQDNKSKTYRLAGIFTSIKSNSSGKVGIVYVKIETIIKQIEEQNTGLNIN